MLKIMWINPIYPNIFDEHMLSTITGIKRSDVEATVVSIEEEGPSHVEYHYYEHINLHGTLRLVKRADKEGYDAACIGCFYDPGLREARELVRIPVVAPAETCMHIASTLGHKFSIIVGRRKWIPKMESNVYLYGLEKNLASFRVIDFTVPRMGSEPEQLKAAIKREARNAIEHDGAEAIVLGCTAEAGFMKELIDTLKVPVLDAVVVTWKYAEMLADLYHKIGLTHSKLFGYEAPPEEDGFLKALE